MESTMTDNCNYCNSAQCYWDEVCNICNGTGKIVDFTVGLGQDGLVPAYVGKICPNCGGHPYRRVFCAYY